MERYSYKSYKDTRDCITKQVINRSMYTIFNHKKRLLVHEDGHLLIFYKMRHAINYITEYGKNKQWKIKKVRLDITTL